MKVQHTPGPWVFCSVPDKPDTHAELVITEPGEDSILYHGADWPMKPADMRLIEIAPRMYKALQEFVKWYSNRKGESDEIAPLEEQSPEVAEAMRILNELDNGN